jgi:hypothetical protein
MNEKQTNEPKKPSRRFDIDPETLEKAIKDPEGLIELEYTDENDQKGKMQIKGNAIIYLTKNVLLTEPVVPKILTKYLTDMTYLFNKKNKIKLVGRDLEIEKIWFYISQKSQNNVFLVGDHDVGKTAICREIIRQITTAECPKDFFRHRVFRLEAKKLSEIESKGKLEFIIHVLFNFLRAHQNSSIVYIDDSFDMLVSEEMWKLIERLIIKSKIPVITTSLPKNMEDYYLEIDSIAKYVNMVFVKEPEIDEIYPMIQHLIKKLEKKYEIKASDEIVEFGICSTFLDDGFSCNPGCTVNMFSRAFLEAKRKGKEELDKESILSCYDFELKMYKEWPESTKRANAYHEMGHYLSIVKSYNLTDTKIAFVSILPKLYYGGATSIYTKRNEETVYSKEYFLDMIALDMAGRVAETRVREKNYGACSDLRSANSIAKQLIMELGLSEEDRLKNRSFDQEDYFIVSEEKKKLIDSEVQKLIDEGYKRAEKIISENEDLLKYLAEILLKEEIISGTRLKQLCDEFSQEKQ